MALLKPLFEIVPVMPTPQHVPVRGRRLPVEGEKARQPVLAPPPSPAVAEGIERTYWVQVLEYLQGGGGLSLMISGILHAILLALLAIPVFQILKQEQVITSVVQGDSGDGLAIGDPGGMELSLAQIEPPQGNPLQNLLIEGPAQTISMLPSLNPSDLPSAPASGKGGKGKGMGTGFGDGMGGTGGIRLIEPPNAIRAGSFSVWAWPIIGQDIKGRLLHGEAGSSPAVLQPYHIVIRLKVPEGKKNVNLADFSGRVMGSDSYVQKIPQDAWFYNGSGDLVRARTGRSIPVINGTAELLIRVPGAGTVAVKDTITVSTRLTDEEQKIELQFQDRQKIQ